MDTLGTCLEPLRRNENILLQFYSTRKAISKFVKMFIFHRIPFVLNIDKKSSGIPEDIKENSVSISRSTNKIEPDVKVKAPVVPPLYNSSNIRYQRNSFKLGKIRAIYLL